MARGRREHSDYRQPSQREVAQYTGGESRLQLAAVTVNIRSP